MKANGWLRVCREEAMDLAKKKKNVEEFEPSRFRGLPPVPKAFFKKRLVFQSQGSIMPFGNTCDLDRFV